MKIQGTMGANRPQEYAGSSQDKVIRELKDKIKELQVQMRKIGRDTRLSKEQKEAEQAKLQTQIETYQQHIVAEQQKKQEAKQKEKEAAKENNQQQAPSKAEEVGKSEKVQKIPEQSVHGLIKADMSLARAEYLDKVQISMEGRANVLKRQIEWDDQMFARTGGALEINREEYFSLKDKIGNIRTAVGEEISKLNDFDKEHQKEDKVQITEQTEQSRNEKENKRRDEKHLDTQA